MASTRTYFAARSKREIGQFLVGKLQDCKAVAESGDFGVREEEANAYRNYYGKELGQGITTGVQRDGALGELATLRLNLSRSYAKALLSLVIGPKISWRPVARNSDAGAMRATTTAAHLLEDYWKNKRFAQASAAWVEQAVAFAQGFIFPEWDLCAGPTIAALPPSKELPNGRLVKAGDITPHNVLPWDRFKDQKARSPHQLNWEFIRLPKNRFDLAKIYHQLSDGRPSLDPILSAQDPLPDERPNDDDVANLYYFFHKPTPAMPMGREVLLLSADCVLKDRKLSYGEVPVYRLAADEMWDTPDGWSQFWDTLAGQEMFDATHSAVATAVSMSGGPVVSMEQGTEVHVDTLADGARVLRRPKGAAEPKVLDIGKVDGEKLKYADNLASVMRQTMGLNDVALGQPQTAQMNAQAFAVLVAMAIQQVNPFQSAYVDGLGRLGTGVMKTISKRVTTERKLQIMGQTSRHLFAEDSYTGKDVAPVEKVIVEIGNAMEQTPMGRITILQDMKALGFILSPEDYQQVVQTGRLEPATRALRDEKLLLAAEFETLSRGEEPVVHPYQNHPLHFRENSAVLSNPENLKNPAVVKAVQNHNAGHYCEFFGLPPGADPTEDPLYLDRVRLMLGQEPPGITAPPPPPGAEVAPPPGAAPEEGGPLGAGLAPAANAELPVEQPTMPDNPITGSPLDLNGGSAPAPPSIM